MKKTATNSILAFFFCILIAGQVGAQQDPQYSQYMFNQLAYNPAYAGSRGALSGTVVMRRQWMGISNGPATASINLHSPSANERHGFGINFVHDRLGVTAQTYFSGVYAYRIPLGPGHLSLGLQGGFAHFATRYSEVVPIDPDPQKPDLDLAAIIPQFGTGVYYQSRRFYAGISVPNLLTGKYFRYKKSITQDFASVQRMHYFLVMGYLIPMGDNVIFRPSFVGKYVADAPMQLDFNGMFFFKQTIGVGAGYRVKDALVFMMEFTGIRRFRAGYAYDYPLSELRISNTGSHELMIGFDFNWGRSRYKTPRYF